MFAARWASRGCWALPVRRAVPHDQPATGSLAHFPKPVATLADRHQPRMPRVANAAVTAAAGSPSMEGWSTRHSQVNIRLGRRSRPTQMVNAARGQGAHLVTGD